jgi:hypothetical protein
MGGAGQYGHGVSESFGVSSPGWYLTDLPSWEVLDEQ